MVCWNVYLFILKTPNYPPHNTNSNKTTNKPKKKKKDNRINKIYFIYARLPYLY